MAEIYLVRGIHHKAQKIVERFIDETGDADLLSLLEQGNKEATKTYDLPINEEILEMLLITAKRRKTSLVSSIEAFLNQRAKRKSGSFP